MRQKYFLQPATPDKGSFANSLKRSTNTKTCKHITFLQNTKKFPLCKNNNIGHTMHNLQDADYFGQYLRGDRSSSVTSNTRALILGTKHSYF